MRTEKLYRRLASLVMQRKNCIEHKNTEWLEKSTDQILALVKEQLPSGGGFDSGTKIDLDRSTPEKLVFYTSFHHMNENGMYDGWTEHTVFVTASMASDFVLVIKGRDRNDIKEYIAQSFEQALTQNIEVK